MRARVVDRFTWRIWDRIGLAIRLAYAALRGRTIEIETAWGDETHHYVGIERKA